MSSQPSKPLLHLPPTPAAPFEVNLLPCRIHHSGPVNATKAYWNPVPLQPVEKGHSERNDEEEGEKKEEESDEKKNEVPGEEAYFRGRRLVGQSLPVGEGYTGYILRPSTIPSLQSLSVQDHDDEDEIKEEAFEMEVVGGFEKVTVWGHEEMVEGGGQVGKALGEWRGWAGVVNGWDEGEDDEMAE
ncbi:ribonuclease H1 small subunit [Ascobolus immersus RN42]|uniref:Ribonuclease H1 small subunit n=1 Tax=Ascobolus immersus RN42 TaxID=1160509 RepID=A0A3N4IML3_ASCIM|nr:ribonuclease H1 small subunit [Ascobolus immersus RN42]